MLALPKAALTAAGLAQSAFDASLNQALSGCSASAYSVLSQNNRSALREMILILGFHYGTIPNWEQRTSITYIGSDFRFWPLCGNGRSNQICAGRDHSNTLIRISAPLVRISGTYIAWPRT